MEPEATAFSGRRSLQATHGEIAKKLGMHDAYTEGRSIKEWMKFAYDGLYMQELVSWEQLKENGFYIIPTDPDWEKVPAGLFKFFEDPEKNPLSIPSGKLEFYSSRLAEHFPDDIERPPSLWWIEHGRVTTKGSPAKGPRSTPCLLCLTTGDGEFMRSVMISLGQGKSRLVKSGDATVTCTNHFGLTLKMQAKGV